MWLLRTWRCSPRFERYYSVVAWARSQQGGASGLLDSRPVLVEHDLLSSGDQAQLQIVVAKVPQSRCPSLDCSLSQAL